MTHSPGEVYPGGDADDDNNVMIGLMALIIQLVIAYDSDCDSD